ncbi:unnamed protein product [Clavelina lepadiformis]|uniref:Sugar phosphate transporter domain-containing protein n=1 Tax=Clavelina lepadiformis TaxID=159417 RepID=A0ABP0GX26_CLALP
MAQNEDVSHKSLQMMAFSAGFYGICSGSMNFINKLLLNTWEFSHPGFILVMQLLTLVAGLKLLNALGKITLISYTTASARSCFLLSLFYSANTLLALFALSGMNVPMYVAMRRCVPLASLIIGTFVFFKRPTSLIILSVSILTLGTIIAGDLEFDLKSYIMGGTSCILMASYLTTLQYNGTVKQMSSIDLLYINSVNCIPLITLTSLGSFMDLWKYSYWTNIGFLLNLTVVVFSGCLLNYSMFLCTTINSAIVTAVVGVAKSGFVTVLGFYFFGGVTPTPLFVSGLAVNFGGGILMAYAKYKQAISELK